MKVIVTLQDLKGQNHTENDFCAEMPELPQVGDLIVHNKCEVNEEAYKQWYPNLQEYGASEAFRVEFRGWAVFHDEAKAVINPFIVVRNMDNN